jgi:hypothetical protein
VQAHISGVYIGKQSAVFKLPIAEKVTVEQQCDQQYNNSVTKVKQKRKDART